MHGLSALRRVARNADGNVALTFAIAFPTLLGAAGLAMDSASFYHQHDHMQAVADSAALAVAKEMHLYLDKPEVLEESGRSRAEAMLAEAGIADRPHTTEVRLDGKLGIAQVDIAMVASSFLPAEIWGENPIRVSSEAKAFGQVRLCVLALRQSGNDVLRADKSAAITAPECAVQSNSKDAKGLSAKDDAHLTSVYNCSAGGYEGDANAFTPAPVTDCPVLDDPLALRTPPTVGGCDFRDLVIENGTQSISPGTYCGGLKLAKNAIVTAEPGVYIITGGKLEVGDGAALRGEYVSFYFDDDAALINFKDKGLVELSAPKDGPMAGILFYENPAAKEGRNFEFDSDSARKLIGTIYLPRGIFKVGGKGKVADASAYTIIVASRIQLEGGNLVVNADYSASDVPVPAGLGPNSSKVALSR